MKTVKIPPYLVIEPSKEVIFYVPNKSNDLKDIDSWIKELNLTDYSGMIINSKCMFNRLKNKECN
ncbi:hypothetical protein [Prochlorococcus marinus]|uniref:hypothetical protein n=1 Tax=Prochlorococcus marinus TaxID=1219 RepID=UPI0002E36530|nr:hypothetical protein [Prochlorococcus marinus]